MNNLIFLVLEGLTNPNTGAVRGMLFVLISLTTALSIVLIAQQKKDRIKEKIAESKNLAEIFLPTSKIRRTCEAGRQSFFNDEIVRSAGAIASVSFLTYGI